jgi:hypothetical protein
LDARDTVFVYSLRDQRADYANPADAVSWSARNNAYTVAIGLLCPVAGLALAFVWLLEHGRRRRCARRYRRQSHWLETP